MSEEVAEIRKLLTPLRLQPVSLEVSPGADERRRKVVARVQSLARQRANARFAGKKPLWALLAAAAVVGAALLVLTRGPVSGRDDARALEIEVLSGRAVHATRGGHSVVSAGERVQAQSGGQLSTMSGARAHVTHPAGLSIDVEPQTVLAFPENGVEADRRRELRLATGEVTLSVDKQAAGHEVWVVTPDARVMVKGTIFSVQVRPTEQGPTTCVRVREGVVAVHGAVSAATLRAGERWGCERPARALKAAGSSAPPVPAAASVPASRTLVTPSGPLAEQNRLLVEAIAAERRGAHGEAERKLQALLSRHPGSPLAKDARVALERVRAAQRP